MMLSYTHFVIRSFHHRGLKKLLVSGSAKGIRPDMATRLQVRLDALHQAGDLDEIAANGWDLHVLSGNSAGIYALRVTANYRLTFRFENGDCFDVDLEDYH